MSRHEREVVPVSRHEREVVPVSRHERETVTTSHYDDFALRRRPSISMTFHYDETFLTRSPLHKGTNGKGGKSALFSIFVTIIDFTPGNRTCFT